MGPSNTWRKSHVPAGRRSDVTPPPGASYAGVRDGFVVYEVGAGDYEFRAKVAAGTRD